MQRWWSGRINNLINVASPSPSSWWVAMGSLVGLSFVVATLIHVNVELRRSLQALQEELLKTRRLGSAKSIQMDLETERLEKETEAQMEALVQEMHEVKTELNKQVTLRNEERVGRTAAEREIRRLWQTKCQDEGILFQPIGYVESCFVDRRGTPRQGVLAPAVKGTIELAKSICPTSLECLDQFSHVWVIFVFHENTNALKSTLATKGRQATKMAKIAPPRLGGKKVGIFSTRSPHRPNAVGLSLVRIQSIQGRSVHICAHDLVHGTPVLDIKPFVPYDNPSEYSYPKWVALENDRITKRTVDLSVSAMVQLNSMIEKRQLRFYSSVNEIVEAIKQVLILDIRSVHQGRGKAMEEGSNKSFTCRLDNLEIVFSVSEEKIHVLTCTARCNSENDVSKPKINSVLDILEACSSSYEERNDDDPVSTCP